MSERELWLAVVANAIIDYHKEVPEFKRKLSSDRKSQWNELVRNKRQAKNWLFKSTNTDVGSLFWVCEQLGLSVAFIRKCAKRGLTALSSL